MTDQPEDLTGAYTPDLPIGCLLPASAPEPPPEALSGPQSAPQASDGDADRQDAHDGAEAAQAGSNWPCSCGGSWPISHLHADEHTLLDARTTPDNPATSSDGADKPLRKALIDAITGELHSPDGPSGVIPRIADAVLAVHDREHAALKRAHVALAAQAGRDQAAIGRVRAASDQLHRAALNADGVPLAAYDRGVDTAVRRIRTALDTPDQPKEQS